ncbi:MAG: response regulator, partial [Planctomycetota bacterium]|nr:response regulator [Planctomycetota bacterium]
MQKEKVVVIEDDPDILEVMNYNLSREGYRVTCEQDGLEGMQRIRKENPDLVLLDLMLPGIEGTEVCRLLKLDPVTRAIPIIMVTAKGEESDIVLGLGLGADDYVCKPFSPKELIARVKAVLRRGSLKEDAASHRRLVRDGVVIDAD